MSILPRLKNCPCCEATNIISINGITYSNPFKTLSEWTLKKKFNCRKCKVELGLFGHARNHKEKVIWLEYFKFDDYYYEQLKDLEESRAKSKKNKKKYDETLEEIERIQDEIRSNKIKLKIKMKIKNKRMLVNISS